MKPARISFLAMTANCFDWYDFTIYAYLSHVITQLFFPENSALIGLIKTVSIFAFSFLTRPLGGLILGYLADKYGRKTALKLSLSLMVFATFLMSLLPTSWGLFSLFILIFLRLIQGFAVGGELPSIITYLYENTTGQQQSLQGTYAAASSIFGAFIASLTVYLLHLFCSEETILAWAWRLPFLLGSLGLLFILRTRLSSYATLPQILYPVKKQSSWQLLTESKQALWQIALLSSFVAICFYLLFVWFPAYLSLITELNATHIFFISSIGTLSLAFFTLLVGYLAITKERTALLFGTSTMFMLIYPVFLLLQQHTFYTLISAEVLLALALSAVTSVLNTIMIRQFAPQIRCRAISIVYTLPVAFWGGLIPITNTYLLQFTSFAPEFFLLIAASLGLIASYYYRPTSAQ